MKIFSELNFHTMDLLRKFNTWRKHGGVWEETDAFVAATFIVKFGRPLDAVRMGSSTSRFAAAIAYWGWQQTSWIRKTISGL